MKRCCAIAMTILLTASISYSQQQPVFVWAKSQGTTGQEYPGNTVTDPAGNIYTVGTINGTSDFDPGPAVVSPTVYGSSDVFISKFDRDGNFLWVKSVGGTNLENGRAIKLDNAGNIVVLGGYAGTADFDPGSSTFNITSSSSGDAFILKLDANGNFIWAKSVGGPLGELPSALAIDASGNIYATGSFPSASADFNPGAGVATVQYAGGYDVFVLKLDASGNFVWARGFGGTSADLGNNISVDASGAVFVTGSFQNSGDFDPGAGVSTLTAAGTNDTFLVKLASDGSFAWAKRFGATGGDTRGSAVEVTTTGDIITSGSYDNTVDFDPGSGTTNLPSSGSDIYIIRLTTDGNFVWAKSIGGGSVMGVQALKLDASDNAYFCGLFQSTGDFDPGPGEYLMTSPYGYGTYLLKLTSAGNFVWGSAIAGSPGGNIKSVVTVNNAGDVVSVGSYSGTRDFDPSACTFSLPLNYMYTLTWRQTAIASDPKITSFSPLSGLEGTQVVINGTNFSATPADNAVMFNQVPAIVTASTATSITTSVPTGASTGKISVTVGCITTTSTTDFTMGAATNELIVYNALSPAGANPKFVIQSIELLPDTKSNTVTIFDRWQNEVWRGTDYDNNAVVFTGSSSSGELPTGTYYYRVEFASGRKALTGFISLKR